MANSLRPCGNVDYRALWALAVAVALGGASACASRPAGRAVVNGVYVEGNDALSSGDVIDHIATQSNETAPILGFITVNYEVYDPTVATRDVMRIERYYQARGYYDAHVVSTRALLNAKGDGANVVFQVSEGPPTKIRAVRIELPDDTDPAVRKLVDRISSRLLTIGDPIDEDTYHTLKKRLITRLTEEGYARAAVFGGFARENGGAAAKGGAGGAAGSGGGPGAGGGARAGAGGEAAAGPSGAAGGAPLGGVTKGAVKANETNDILHQGKTDPGEKVGVVEDPQSYGVRVDDDAHGADVLLRLEPGPRCHFGAIRIEGIPPKIPEDKTYVLANIKKGDRYSTSELDSARDALLQAGVFGTVEYEPDLTGEGDEITVTFRVTSAPLHTVTIGGGAQLDAVQSDVHIRGDYEHNNFLGGLRKLSLNLTPGVAFYPTNIQNVFQGCAPKNLLPKVSAKAELQQPGFLEARTVGHIRSSGQIYPFITPFSQCTDVPQTVVGYRILTEGLGVDRAFFHSHLLLSADVNQQLNYPFAYLGSLGGSDLQRVLVSYLSLGQTIDFRNDPLDPKRGFFIRNEVQLAGGPFTSGVDVHHDASGATSTSVRKFSDVRWQPDARIYVTPVRRFTIAARASVGFVFPSNYGDSFKAGQTPSTLDEQLVFFRGFFSGGPNSNRGYPLRGVGPREVAPFYLNNNAASGVPCFDTNQNGAPTPHKSTDPAFYDGCAIPIGGLSLWESSIEFRYKVTTPLTVATFVDASDVERERLTVRLNHPHLSPGLGIRYDTPVGPIRADIAYAVPGLQEIATGSAQARAQEKQDEQLKEGQPASVFGLKRVGLSLAIGEAF